jgi:hypothetical protein
MSFIVRSYHGRIRKILMVAKRCSKLRNDDYYACVKHHSIHLFPTKDVLSTAEIWLLVTKLDGVTN